MEGNDIKSRKRVGSLNIVEGTPVSDRGSRFIAIVAYPVTNKRQATEAIIKSRAHSSIVSADARISAYRISKDEEDEDDDGEARAGHQLLIALRKLKVTNVAVVVGRWWNGNIGKARFTHIRERATSLLLACGAKKTPNMALLRWSHSGKGRSLEENSSAADTTAGSKPERKKRKERRELFAMAAERQKYNDAIYAHPEAVEAGADFPDFLYACGSYADHVDAGEAAHWPQWSAAAAAYIRARPDFQSGNWTEDTKKLIAFAFGVNIHFATDELWEGLFSNLAGNGQGFVELVGGYNLANSGSQDSQENPVNVGGDFYTSFKFDESKLHIWDRYFPLKDIVNIYHRSIAPYPDYDNRTYSNVTLFSLQECSVLFNLGLWAEKVFGKVLFHITTAFVYKTPVIAEIVTNYPYGHDFLAFYSAEVWQRTAQWLDNGPPINAPRSLKETFSSSPSRKLVDESGDDDQDGLFTHDYFQAFKDFIPLVDDLKNLGNIKDIFTITNLEKPWEGLKYNGPKNLENDMQMMLLTFAKFLLGEKVPDFNFMEKRTDHIENVMMKPPTNLLHSTEPIPIKTLTGSGSLQHYGKSVVSGDFDADGDVDLVISGYGSGEKGRMMVGQVSVTYNYLNNTLAKTDTITGKHKGSRFGWSMGVIDINLDGVDDLLVGAPFESYMEDDEPVYTGTSTEYKIFGQVNVYLGRKGMPLRKSPDFSISTNINFLNLGMFIDTSQDLNGDGHSDLLLGCPLAQSSLGAHQGRIFGLFSKESNGNSFDIEDGNDIHFSGVIDNEWFGRSVASWGKYLFIGAPGHRITDNSNHNINVGAVHVFERVDTSYEAIFTITGVEQNGEFGHQVFATDADTPQKINIFASAPAAGELLHLQGGKVFLLNLPSNLTNVILECKLTKGDDVSLSSQCMKSFTSSTINGPLFSRLGLNMEMIDVNDDGFKDLIVGAPLTNGALILNEPEHGALYVWYSEKGDFPKIKGSINADASTADWFSQGTSDYGRFGAEIEVISKGRLIVSSPETMVNSFERCGKVEEFKLL
eukprot:g1838.t1